MPDIVGLVGLWLMGWLLAWLLVFLRARLQQRLQERRREAGCLAWVDSLMVWLAASPASS
jgi:hypothetical protein